MFVFRAYGWVDGNGRVGMPPTQMTFKKAQRVREEKKQPGLLD